jgi:hypothetical protein
VLTGSGRRDAGAADSWRVGGSWLVSWLASSEGVCSGELEFLKIFNANTPLIHGSLDCGSCIVALIKSHQ